jgi:pyruvate/2-oxoglutarate dehydrogenase complex dihydrolipoamide acyltransferase (E2) component
LATTVSMPQLGETVTEGTILKWAKKVGDSIAEDEVLVEISTDKVDTEVPSPAAGTILEILVDEGDTVQVGTPMVVIGAAGESTADSETVEAPIEPDSSQAEQPTGNEAAGDGQRSINGSETKPSELSDREVEAFFAEPDETDKKPHLLSPVVRKLIREHDIDVSRLTGSGEGGRITRKDVEAFIESGVPSETAAAEEAPPEQRRPEPEEKAEPEPAPAPPAPAPPAPAASGVASGASDEEVPLDRIRLRIAENMVNSKQTAAHVWTSVEVDYERVERVRQAHKADFKNEEGFSLTYLPFISRATIDALKAFPVVNSSFYLEEKRAVFHKKVDLGIAIDLNQGGLIVARVRNADGLRLVGLAREIRELAERGRTGSLGLDDLTGSTFTITNPGPFGSFMSAPIINVPNVAILSTETVTKRPTVITTPEGQDMIAIRHIGYLGLTWDHRAFDGSTAVLFLQRIKQNIETWDWEQELA